MGGSESGGKRRDPELDPGAENLMRSGCSPLYSDVKELNATAFAIPSYNGGSLGRVVSFMYVFENIAVSYVL